MNTTFSRTVSWHRRGALLLAGFLLAATSVTGASGQTAPLRVGTNLQPPPSPEPPALDIRNNAIQLSVDRAIDIALQRNLAIVIQRYTRVQQRLTIIEALGLYDLNATIDAIASNRNQPAATRFEASQAEEEDLNFGVRQRTPQGGEVSVGWGNGRSSTDISDLTTSYSSGLTFAFTQPLLRNFGRYGNERNIIVAQINSQLSRQDFELQVTAITQQVVNAYWNLVNAREQLGVAQQSLQLARDLHARNKIQVEVGTLPPLDLTQSDAAIATREAEIIRATSAVGDAEDELRRLLNLPAGPLWSTGIVPTSDPKTAEKVNVNVEEALRIAIAQRPELRSQEIQLAQARRDAEYFRGQLKPTLDLNVNYGYRGLGTGFSGALNQITGLDFRSWTAQLNFAYPIQNRTARAQSASANIAVDRLQALYDQQRLVIETEVRRAARAVDTAFKSIDAAHRAREFQDKNLDAEKKKYENGLSTAFQITQIQDQLTQARSDEVTATVNYRTALAEYYRSVGRLLDQQGVTLDDPAEGDAIAHRYSFSRALLPGEVR
ncbi:MAG TPA: TolC family protein [Thermoanaerobaculia bacterium]|nr:TolC family protein [Thermoanaerobaculia bacterium]